MAATEPKKWKDRLDISPRKDWAHNFADPEYMPEGYGVHSEYLHIKNIFQFITWEFMINIFDMQINN